MNMHGDVKANLYQIIERPSNMLRYVFQDKIPFLHGSGQIFEWTKSDTDPPFVYTGPANP